MSDEQNVEAGSGTSGETAVDTTATEQSETETTTTDTPATDTVKTDEGASADAGGAADETASTSGTSGETADESRTGFADKGLHTGDRCVCPDGRKGTVHSFDAGLICIPNADQGE